MKQIAPMASVWHQAERDYTKNTTNKSRWLRRNQDALDYLASEHKYVLRAGEADKETVTMTGRQARDLNTVLFDEFVSGGGLRAGLRLSRWCLIKEDQR